MMKAVAYHRTRPGEPDASDLAFGRQREAVQREVVQREVEESGLDLVAEFIEREGEKGSETHPAFTAAVRAASAHSRGEGFIDVMLLIVTQAGIGTGEPFDEPNVESAGGFMRSYLQVSSIPKPPEIEIPAGAPGPLCLYADCRPCQLDTLVYFCNAGPDALGGVVVTTDTISMNEFFSSKWGEEPWAEGRTRKQRWDVVPPGMGVIVASLDHCIWDYVKRYRIAYTDPAGRRWTALDGAGRRWTAEAHDVDLTVCNLPEDPEKAWVAFCQSREAVQPAP